MLFTRKKKRIQSQRAKRPSFARHIMWGILLFLVLGLVCTGIYYGTRMRMFTIQDVAVEGGTTIPHEAIEQEVMQELGSSYIRLIPYTFALTYPHDAIVSDLRTHPRLYNPEVERTGLTHLRVRFDEYVPYALLCGSDATQPCFVIDENGFAFEEAGSLSGGALIRYIDEARTKINRGDSIPSERLHATDHFIAHAESELGLRIGSVTYTDDGDIHFAVNGGGELLVSATRSLDESYEDIHTVLNLDAYKKLKPGDFQYVDARFPPKIFVNDSVASTTEDATASTTESE